MQKKTGVQDEQGKYEVGLCSGPLDAKRTHAIGCPVPATGPAKQPSGNNQFKYRRQDVLCSSVGVCLVIRKFSDRGTIIINPTLI
jgi:hypothetical protein